jgi:hypothetical protein
MGSSKFQMPALDNVPIEPPVKMALDDLGRQLSQQFDNRVANDQARYSLLLYSPDGTKVWQLYVDDAGVVKTTQLTAPAARGLRRNA